MDSYSPATVPTNLVSASDGFDRPGPFTTPRTPDDGHWQKENPSDAASNNPEKMEVDRPSSSQHKARARPAKKKSSSSSSKPSKPRRNAIPRPPNAFMVFRSAFCAEQRLKRTIEHDHRHISRIVGHCWNKMSEEERDVWRAKAAVEKEEHARKYPGYVFTPTPRTRQPKTRKVKRSGPEDLKRCEMVADLILMGKQGEDLAEAIKDIKLPTYNAEDFIPRSSAPLDLEDPPFRSPLLHNTMFSDHSPPYYHVDLPPARWSSSTKQTIKKRDEYYTADAATYTHPDHWPRFPPISHYYAKSILLQMPLSPEHSDDGFEESSRYFTRDADSFDTLDSVDRSAAPSPAPPGSFRSPQRPPFSDASITTRQPSAESTYDFDALSRRVRSASPNIDYFTTATRLPDVDGSTVEDLPRPVRPAKVTEEPVVFRNPFASAEP